MPTSTHVNVFGDAPCGCRMAIPNEAYERPYRLEPCVHGLRWIIAVVDEGCRWAPAEAETIAQAFHAAYETLAPQLGYTTRRATALPWDLLAPAARLLMILTAAEALAAGVVVAGPGPDAIGLPDPDQGRLELEDTDPTLSSTRCQACHAPIAWRTHVGTGRRAPIDMYANPEGNVLLVVPAAYTVIGPGGTFPDGEPRYTNHFATCPRAAEFQA